VKPSLVLIGGGGHCRACIDVIEAEGGYRIAGILDAARLPGDRVFDYPVLGGDEEIAALTRQGAIFLITIGQLESPRRRAELFRTLKSLGAKLATIVSPSASVSARATLGEGTIVMHHALVAAGSAVGENCIINHKALVDHDARVGNHSHVSTAAVLNGAAVAGEGCFLGSASVLLQQVEIAPGCAVGAGPVVRKSIREPGIYAGEPLRKLRSS
jgi:sugar O-acyltransferase (sialic acid O-acetyltransferase NeuD family)